ncbi:MAG: hypothetical protein ACXWC0_22150, partial [Burkholderiales bacterium]
MRFPMLRGAVLVAIEQRRIGDVFAGRWTQTIDVGTDRIDGFENSIAPRVHEIASTGSADTKVNVAIL